MKKLVVLALAGCFFLGIWQWIASFTLESTVKEAIQDVLDNAKHANESEVQEAILRRVQEKGVPLQPEGLEVRITVGGQPGAPSALVQQHGLQTVSKNIQVRANYPYKILGIPFSRVAAVGQNYTLSAALPERPIENYGE